MNKKIKGAAVGALALSLTLVSGANVFADTNKYNITYQGGQLLSGTYVNIDSDLVTNLEANQLVGVKTNTSKLSFSGSLWKTGYQRLGVGESVECHKAHYLEIHDNDSVKASNNTTFSITDGDYAMTAKINEVIMDNVTGLSSNGKFLPIVVDEENNYLYYNSGYVYKDSGCTTKVDNIAEYSAQGIPVTENDAMVFVNLNVKLTKNGKQFASDGLYFGVRDFDSAQSFKVLTSDNELKKANTFAASEAIIQPANSNNLKNYYVSDSNGSYVYSGFATGQKIISNSKTNMYLKLGNAAQTNGLDIVYGFHSTAGSPVSYYANQYKVTYVSDEYGDITGIEAEDVIKNDNPSGSEQKPNDGYEFTYWTADKDIKLEDGTEIKTGEKITSEQIKQVVVDQDIKFTAHHVATSKEDDKKGPAAPNTGASTGEFNAAPIAVSVLGITLGALFVRLLPRLTHKKIKFN